METDSLKDSEVGKIYPSRRGLAGAAVLIFRFTLGAIFIFAGIQKARDVTLFAADIRGYRLLPDWLISPVACYLPFLEIFVGSALALRIAYSGALLLSGSMLGLFLASLGAAIWRGLDINCGCFGHGDSRSVGTEMGIDGFLFAVWILLVWKHLKDRRTIGLTPHPESNAHIETPGTV